MDQTQTADVPPHQEAAQRGDHGRQPLAEAGSSYPAGVRRQGGACHERKNGQEKDRATRGRDVKERREKREERKEKRAESREKIVRKGLAVVAVEELRAGR